LTRLYSLRSLFVASLCAFALLAAACGPGGGDTGSSPSGNSTPVGGGTQASGEIKIAAKDNVFEPKSVTVPAGKAVKVTFTNEGQNPHEVEIKDLTDETMLQPGQSKTFTITPEKKTYKMYCEIHEDQGMEGEFIGK
jgi:plastocyanin